MGVGSSVEQPPPPSAQARSNTRTRKPGQREVGFVAFGIELLGLVEGVSSGTDQAERLLALAELQPEEEMSGIQVDGLLQQAIDLNAAHFLLWLELGQCQQALGLVGPARNSFNQAKQLNPKCHEANLALTRLSGSGIRSRLRGWWRRLFNR